MAAVGHPRPHAVHLPRLLHRQSPSLAGKEENFRALACEPIYGYDSDRNEAQHIVLDGQQRLTAMYYTFVAPNVPAPNRANRYLYFIQVDRFMEMAYDRLSTTTGPVEA